MHEMRKYYNLSEANELVPRLEFLFAELARIQQEVNSIYTAAGDAGVDLRLEHALDWKSLEVSGVPSLDDRIRALSERYLSLADEIAGMGVVMCDVDSGTVGFYSWFDGQEILLSWQYGEPEVQFWHSVNEDPQMRRSLMDLVADDQNFASIH
jgi:hypothetical protein